MGRGKNFLIVFVALSLLAGCAGIARLPVREAMEENIKLPVGKIEGSQFAGIRYPFKISIPPNWEMSMEFPAFLEEFGYDKPAPYDKEQNELYLFNPQTKSSIQIDLTPADRYTRFSQEKMEALVSMGAGSFRDELEKEWGKGVKTEVSPTERVGLKGIQFAAKKYATYIAKGVKREQGWIFGFTEPYQIFVLYMIVDKDGTGTKDHQDMKTILDSFELMPKK